LEEIANMLTTNSSARRTRQILVRTIAVGVIVAMSPLAIGTSPVVAESPAISVSGLARGAHGDAVKAVQQALVNQGVAVPGGVDGIFGANTESALKGFQTSNGIAATGIVDDATALALGLASSPLLGLTQGTQGDAVKTLQQ
jgi:peptidoglycan hydrolase-like protein with peptidoglycan-binding domain